MFSSGDRLFQSLRFVAVIEQNTYIKRDVSKTRSSLLMTQKKANGCANAAKGISFFRHDKAGNETDKNSDQAVPAGLVYGLSILS